jgi:hypothetical protein
MYDPIEPWVLFLVAILAPLLVLCSLDPVTIGAKQLVVFCLAPEDTLHRDSALPASVFLTAVAMNVVDLERSLVAKPAPHADIAEDGEHLSAALLAPLGGVVRVPMLGLRQANPP